MTTSSANAKGCFYEGWNHDEIDRKTGEDWRDIEPPEESLALAAVQRIEESGEICGLTPPCPDCGSSLIDVPEGSL